MVAKVTGGMEILGQGIVQYASCEIIIVSKGYKLFFKSRNGTKWKPWCVLPVSLSNKIFSFNCWLSRFSRKEVHHVIKVKEGIFACFAFGNIYLIDENVESVEKIGEIKGSRPLDVSSDGGSIYYGVYKNNKDRNPIELFRYSFEEKEWTVYHIFKNIRHIHGVFWDGYESKLWVTTGDLDHESTIWRFNDNGRQEKVVTGSQQTRAVDLLFTEKAVFYATDAPHERNYIYRLDRGNKDIKPLQAVGGPVFYGRKVNDWLFFSTVVEPSEVNRTDAVELWASNDQGNSWRKMHEFQKDIGHMKLFQYGQIKFPSGPGDGKNIWFTPYATKHDHKIIRTPLG